MPGRVSCWLYLLLDALENFDISLDLQFREISNFPTHLEALGSPRSILRIKPRMYADGLLPEATTTTPIAT